jgi:hypothetical protein
VGSQLLHIAIQPNLGALLASLVARQLAPQCQQLQGVNLQ